MPGHDSSFDQDKTMLAEMDNVSRDSRHSDTNYFYNRCRERETERDNG